MYFNSVWKKAYCGIKKSWICFEFFMHSDYFISDGPSLSCFPSFFLSSYFQGEWFSCLNRTHCFLILSLYSQPKDLPPPCDASAPWLFSTPAHPSALHTCIPPSNYADCSLHPQINFLVDQNGLILIWCWSSCVPGTRQAQGPPTTRSSVNSLSRSQSFLNNQLCCLCTLITLCFLQGMFFHLPSICQTST